jgi:hypothetical protein
VRSINCTRLLVGLSFFVTSQQFSSFQSISSERIPPPRRFLCDLVRSVRRRSLSIGEKVIFGRHFSIVWVSSKCGLAEALNGPAAAAAPSLSQSPFTLERHSDESHCPGGPLRCQCSQITPSLHTTSAAVAMRANKNRIVVGAAH